jgi:glycosyltransferase involved in cell wall biosynthesis
VRILYHHTAPRASIAGTEAVVQEVELLRAHFGGEVVALLPPFEPRAMRARPLYGWHRLPAILRLEQRCDLHHVYNSDLYLFPILRLLRKPIVYTVVSGLRPRFQTRSVRALRRLRGVAVPALHDVSVLEDLGLRNVRVVRPGIDVARFRQTPPPTGREFVLLAGSAPWIEEQFRSKGFETLFRVAEHTPWLRLILLWRGRLRDELQRRLARARLIDRVDVIDEWVDVNEVLARAHAAIVLARTPDLIKAFPHSLIEALACGRPAVTNACVPMADYLLATGTGEVAEAVSERAVLAAIERLKTDYAARQARAVEVGPRDFSREGLIAAYHALYEAAVG